MQNDRRLSEAKSIPIEEIVERLGIQGLRGGAREVVGPCPVCGGRDRFGVNKQTGVFNCRHCGGGDGIRLVELVLGVEFKDALSWLVGDADHAIDPKEVERRANLRAAEQAKRDRQAEQYRARVIDQAQRLWRSSVPAEGTPVADYLELRGIHVAALGGMPRALRFNPSVPYFASNNDRGNAQPVHVGPAMIGAIVDKRGQVIGVHRTWIDLARPGGKAKIVSGDAVMSAKKILGSKKGGAIRFDRHIPDGAALVMGEGIETTLTAKIAGGVHGAIYWAGIDLGNMGGRALRGKGLKFAGLPDMSDSEAFVPPPWISRLIYIQDGDSDPRATRAILEAGLRRAKALCPTLSIQIVHAGEGVDLNDVLMMKGAEA